MKFLFSLLIGLVGQTVFAPGPLRCLAQKLPIDSSVYANFPRLDNPVLSGDGKYFSCNEQNEVSAKSGGITTVRSTKEDWKIEIKQVKNWPRFTADSKYFVFGTIDDKLGIVRLGTNSPILYIENISEFEVPSDGLGEWMTFKKHHDNGIDILVLFNLQTQKEILFESVSQSWLAPNGASLLVLKNTDKAENKAFEWLDLRNGKTIRIWDGQGPDNVVVDFNHTQFAFKRNDSVMYYKTGMPNAVGISYKSNDGLKLNSINAFSKHGDRLFVDFERVRQDELPIKNELVDIWSYITPLKIKNRISSGFQDLYRSAILLSERKVVSLQINSEESGFYGAKDDVFLISCPKENGDRGERLWNAKSESVFHLVDGLTGTRTALDFLNGNAIWMPSISPGGRFITYYDSNQKSYFSYDISRKKLTDLTKNVPMSWDVKERNTPYPISRAIAGWFPGDEAFLVYDSFDIWKIDPLGKQRPVNLTNGYGADHQIAFSLALDDESAIVPRGARLILTALNVVNKDNGFYSLNIDRRILTKLSMGPFLYKTNRPNIAGNFDFSPRKAKKGHGYLVKREQATEFPNYFYTTDFKVFKPLTYLQPQRKYNWYSTELLSWKSFEGKSVQGVLYKPEDFDSNKKYPVIFYYYQRHADGLNAFIKPAYSYGAIDIPTFVSNGYLVFCPDIYHPIGKPMQGTYDAVVSAARYLSGFPYVDSEKMGLQGHSFGAGQTNYLICHSDLFAAACSSSGISDWISNYGSEPSKFEYGQYRMGSTIWQNLEGYINNSPIMAVDRVVTPLLMMHTKNDTSCPFSNALEFFSGLRRLGKRVWMLAYAKGNHVLKGEESQDFTIRMMQFFDHYLKGKPAPIWMTRGNDSSYDYDMQIKTPGLGLLNPAEQGKVDSLLKKGPTTMILR